MNLREFGKRHLVKSGLNGNEADEVMVIVEYETTDDVISEAMGNIWDDDAFDYSGMFGDIIGALIDNCAIEWIAKNAPHISVPAISET